MVLFAKVRRLGRTEDGNSLPVTKRMESGEDSGGCFLGCERLELAEIFTSLPHVED